MTTYVFDFTQGNKDQKDLLGGKGATRMHSANTASPDTQQRPYPTGTAYRLGLGGRLRGARRDVVLSAAN